MKPSVPRSSRRTPSCTISTSLTWSQRCSSFAGASRLVRSFMKLSMASAMSLRPSCRACFAPPDALATASCTSFFLLSVSFSFARSRTSCRKAATVSTAFVQGSFGSLDTRRCSTPSMDMVNSTSSAAFSTGARQASRESIVALASSTNLDTASTTFGVAKLSRMALWMASLQAATEAANFSSPPDFRPPFLFQNSRLPRKCFILLSSAFAMSIAWSE
mmetsp:Transcript_128184/g.304335  ORF Transcript_128184/g.304335 Transcript_128184/m.304335 type:complete len:218 (+) Transcript_128184:516-1169(+)